MGVSRNGARTFLTVVAKACKLSRLPGFRVGLNNILGATNGDALWAVFDPFCAVVDGLIAADNFFNQKDAQDDDGTGEDIAPA